MKNRIVRVPSIVNPIAPSPGFEKKELSTFKLDILGLCGFGCRYCSSNWGNYLRIRRDDFATLTEEQLGERVTPDIDPALTFVWPDVLARLERQLDGRRSDWGKDETLMFSMLTDGFSPVLVANGTTERALELVMKRTAFRVRVLTKNAVVGTRRWIEFFSQFPGRFVVGLSTGTLDDAWARRVETGTSSPTARLASLRALQDAGIPTYGMMCPVFPDLVEAGRVTELLSRIRPECVEHVWAEPYNDRVNWRTVRDSYAVGTWGHEWFTAVYQRQEKDRWSRYALDLYVELRDRAIRDGWLQKLRFLLYEDQITEPDAAALEGLQGVLLQSKPDEHGRNRNLYIATMMANANATNESGGQ